MKTIKRIAATMGIMLVFAVVILQLIGAACLVSLVFIREVPLALRVIGLSSGIGILIGFVCAGLNGWINQFKEVGDLIKSYKILMR